MSSTTSGETHLITHITSGAVNQFIGRKLLVIDPSQILHDFLQ